MTTLKEVIENKKKIMYWAKCFYFENVRILMRYTPDSAPSELALLVTAIKKDDYESSLEAMIIYLFDFKCDVIVIDEDYVRDLDYETYQKCNVSLSNDNAETDLIKLFGRDLDKVVFSPVNKASTPLFLLEESYKDATHDIDVLTKAESKKKEKEKSGKNLDTKTHKRHAPSTITTGKTLHLQSPMCKRPRILKGLFSDEDKSKTKGDLPLHPKTEGIGGIKAGVIARPKY